MPIKVELKGTLVAFHEFENNSSKHKVEIIIKTDEEGGGKYKPKHYPIIVCGNALDHITGLMRQGTCKSIC